MYVSLRGVVKFNRVVERRASKGRKRCVRGGGRGGSGAEESEEERGCVQKTSQYGVFTSQE